MMQLSTFLATNDSSESLKPFRVPLSSSVFICHAFFPRGCRARCNPGTSPEVYRPCPFVSQDSTSLPWTGSQATSRIFSYSATYLPSNAPKTSEKGQTGTNQVRV